MSDLIQLAVLLGTVAAVVLLGPRERKRSPEAWDRLIDALEELEGERIPHRRSIRKIQVQIGYSWSE